MKDPWAGILLCFFIISLVVCTGAAIIPEQNATPDSPLLLKEQLSELTAFVKDGVSYAHDHTKDEALAAFNEGEGDFVKGEQYLFAYDMNGTTLSLPYEPELIGSNRMNLTDSNGMEFIRGLTYVAGYGGGYLYYVYPNPARNFTSEVKLAYVEPVDDTWFIGSGIYLPTIHAVFDEDAVSGLVSRVEKAAVYGGSEGKEQTSEAFNDLNGTWAKDSAYIFAYSFDGTTLAMPYQPESIGTNRWNYTDSYGSPIARLEIDIAKAGGGFVYVVYYNPESGKDELKLCYVLPVQPDWLVGSGIYTGQELSDGDISS